MKIANDSDSNAIDAHPVHSASLLHVAMKAMDIAAQHKDANGSAKICYQDALEVYERGCYEHAYRRALCCIRYAVGIDHHDFQDVRGQMEDCGLTGLR